MAKGLRSSVKKSNRTKLRQRVFGPVEQARTERLHAKLLEAVQQPKPERPAKMEIDSTEGTAAPGNVNPTSPQQLSHNSDSNTTAEQDTKEDEFPKDMEIDDGATPATRKPLSKTQKKKMEEKKSKGSQRRRKPRNQISFPQTRGKGALKPFSESRVAKRR
ncbi:hypothetical protein BDV96DRAFT_576058 [Lophiotrema nucula]|uniref:DUF2423 domain-containing protein n=1 Tax=Lophiotrema nucula TaxID=690887 RepID=A0A6A5Z621_9PLEO|nr:hypothetical protein BDV96DRAFT_576058 [Lophiotrema nucula]